jgi:hypothetical protein
MIRPQIRFARIASDAQDDINRGLVHDLAHGRVVSGKIWRQFGKEVLKEKRYILFNNSWLYEMQSAVKISTKLLIGALGAYNDSDKSAFGVMMDHQTAEFWWKLTDKNM